MSHPNPHVCDLRVTWAGWYYQTYIPKGRYTSVAKIIVICVHPRTNPSELEPEEKLWHHWWIQESAAFTWREKIWEIHLYFVLLKCLCILDLPQSQNGVSEVSKDISHKLSRRSVAISFCFEITGHRTRHVKKYCPGICMGWAVGMGA